jgi:high-affinity nickel-transport protein
MVVGGIEALGLLAGQFHRQGVFWDAVGKLNKNFRTLGYCIVALFALCWCISIWIYNWRRFDDLELEA